MRYLLSILFLWISLTASGTKYYIDAAGTDAAGEDGSIAEPWATLAYAATRATTSGDTIYVNAGSYTETAVAVIAVGVSIQGAGETSHITYTYDNATWTNACIQLVSASEGTNGNQSISYLKINGSTQTAHHGILVRCRSNVKVHHCTIIDFNNTAIQWNGKSATYTYNNPPTTYATGNELHDCTITDCARNAWSEAQPHHGLITIAGQSGLLIYNNTLSQIDGASGSNMNIIDATEGTNKGVKFYSNTTDKPYSNGSVWNMHIESWDVLGGFEIYDNIFNGGGQHIDIGGTYNQKGSYDYSWYIHDNLFKQDEQQVLGSKYTIGIDIEGGSDDVIIAYNKFEKLPFGIYHSISQADRSQDNINIYYNIFEDLGYADDNWCSAVTYNSTQATATFTGIYYRNNVFHANSTHPARAGWDFNFSGKIDELYIQNNVIINFDVAPFNLASCAGQIDSLYSQNNDIYNTGNSNAFKIAGGESITNYVNENNINSDPLFTGGTEYDFSLQAESPCIDAGLDVDLTTDYAGNTVGSTPDIGAYEYQTESPPTGTKVLLKEGKPIFLNGKLILY